MKYARKFDDTLFIVFMHFWQVAYNFTICRRPLILRIFSERPHHAQYGGMSLLNVGLRIKIL